MNYYGYELIRESDLQHYGLKGMRWGIRRWQNYDATNSFNEAGIQRYFGRAPGENSKSAKETGTFYDRKKATKETKAIIAKQSKFEREDEKHFLSEATKQRVKEIVSSKEFKVGMTIAVAAVGTYALYKLGHRHLMKMATDKTTWIGKMAYDDGMERLSEFPKNFDSLDDIPRDFAFSAEKYFNSTNSETLISAERTAGELVNYVNEGGWGTATRSNNCTFCSSAIIMRLKGYNVDAGETLSGFSDTVYSDFWEGSKFQIHSGVTKHSLEKALKQVGEGHYGTMSVRWKSGGGHSLAYAIRNNRLEIFDGQVNEVYIQGSAAYDQLLKSINISETTFADLTNCNPTDLLLKVVKGAF